MTTDCRTCREWFPAWKKLCPVCKDRERKFNLATRMVEDVPRVREGV